MEEGFQRSLVELAKVHENKTGLWLQTIESEVMATLKGSLAASAGAKPDDERYQSASKQSAYRLGPSWDTMLEPVVINLRELPPRNLHWNELTSSPFPHGSALVEKSCSNLFPQNARKKNKLPRPKGALRPPFSMQNGCSLFILASTRRAERIRESGLQSSRALLPICVSRTSRSACSREIGRAHV